MTSASNSSRPRKAALRTAALGLLLAASWGAQAASVTLCVEPYTLDLPGAPAVPMWGYRQVSDSATCSSAPSARITASSPLITVPAGDTTLVVTLVNRLTVPTSIVIAAQGLPTGAGAPVMAPDVVGATCTPSAAAAASAPDHPLNCRVRSFTGEAAPGATVDYTFSNLRVGTYLYQSGTHPQVQVQMGLAGLAKVVPSAPSGYDYDAPVVLSEVDPLMHATIASTLGTATPNLWKDGKNSTLNYAPRYFLVNGRVFTGVAADGSATTDIPVGASTGSRIGLRIVNAGLQSRSLMLAQGTWRLIAEDGYAYPAPREQATALVPAGKTLDAVVGAVLNTDSTPNRSIVVFDRRGGTDNFDGTMLGGQVARLAMTDAGPAPNQPPVVNAGANRLVNAPTATVVGTVTDDGKLAPLVTTWSLVSGPGAVTFGSASSLTTTVALSAPGRYTLRLSAYDGEYTSTSTTVVTYNTPPVVNAGAAQTVSVAQATLTGTVTDDGMVAPVVPTWSLVSGPGTATFVAPNALTTEVTFSTLGTYTLRLSAYDGQFTVTSDVLVSAVAGKHVADLDQAAVRIATIPWSGSATISVHNALHQPVANALVAGTWTGTSAGGTNSCTTNASGTCTVTRVGIPNATTSTVFSVTGVTNAAAAGTYAPAANHDPDTGAQASNGTSITVPRP